jgi:hypothetical protein
MAKEFTPQDAMEFFQKMWNPLGLPVPGMTPQQGGQPGAAGGAGAMPPFMPPFPPNVVNPFMSFDPGEVERKINEFKTVEGWLTMQIGMLQMMIKTMEMQKASLEALRAQTKSMSAAAKPAGKDSSG